MPVTALGSSQTLCYQGHAFYAGFDKGKASGEIQVSQTHIRFSHKLYQQSFAIKQVKLTLGGASNRLVFIKNPHQPDWTFYTADRSILNNPLLQLDSTLNAQMGKAKWIRKINWLVALTLLAALVLLPLSTIFFMDNLSKIAAEQVPPEWEQKLGETAFAQYSLGHDKLQSDESTLHLKALTQPLLAAVAEPHPKFRLYLVNDPAINAFALPGGIIVLNSGLILSADSADQVLGVLAHEISHVTEQHGLRNILSTASTYLFVQVLIGDASGVLATLAGAAPLLIGQQYSRRFESQADQLGFELLTKANINPQGLADFFAIIEADKDKKKQASRELKEQTKEAEQSDSTPSKSDESGNEDGLSQEQIEQQDESGNEDGLSQEQIEQQIEQQLEPWLSSHPATQDRIAVLQKQIQDLPKQEYMNLNQPFMQLKILVEEFVTQSANNKMENTDEI